MNKPKTIPLNTILKDLNIRWETDLNEEFLFDKMEKLSVEIVDVQKKMKEKTREMDEIAQSAGYRNYSHMEQEWLKEAKTHGYNNVDQYFKHLDEEEE